MSFKRNTAGNLPFAMIDRRNGNPFTSGNVTVKRLLDDGNQEDAEGTVTTKGNGQFNFAYTADDVNGSVIGLLFLATNAIPLHIVITTEEDTSTLTYNYQYGSNYGKTLEEQLISVQTTILAIETGAQSVTLDGRTRNYADLRTLYAREERLQRMLHRANVGRISVAEF